MTGFFHKPRCSAGSSTRAARQRFDDEVERVRSVIDERGASVDVQMHPTRRRASRH